jgi:hypothetical protein
MPVALPCVSFLSVSLLARIHACTRQQTSGKVEAIRTAAGQCVHCPGHRPETRCFHVLPSRQPWRLAAVAAAPIGERRSLGSRMVEMHTPTNGRCLSSASAGLRGCGRHGVSGLNKNFLYTLEKCKRPTEHIYSVRVRHIHPTMSISCLGLARN